MADSVVGPQPSDEVVSIIVATPGGRQTSKTVLSNTTAQALLFSMAAEEGPAAVQNLVDHLHVFYLACNSRSMALDDTVGSVCPTGNCMFEVKVRVLGGAGGDQPKAAATAREPNTGTHCSTHPPARTARTHSRR